MPGYGAVCGGKLQVTFTSTVMPGFQGMVAIQILLEISVHLILFYSFKYHFQVNSGWTKISSPGYPREFKEGN